jgi:hypothetical protein
MTETLRACYKRSGKLAQVREINNSLDALQHLVGGYIEVAPGYWGEGVALICNEEGLMLDMPYNCMGLFGPVVWLGVAGEDFRSLTDEEVTEIMQVYGE